jgi:hypothetical protein
MTPAEQALIAVLAFAALIAILTVLALLCGVRVTIGKTPNRKA